MQSNSTETVIVTMNIKPKSRPWPVAPKKTIRLRIPGPRGKCFTNRLEWQERMAAKQIKPRPRRKEFRIKEQANMHNSIIQYTRDNAESDESDDDSGTLIPGNDVLNSSIASINISGSQKEIGHNSGEAINEIRDCESEPHNQHHAITTASLNPEHAIYTEPGVTGVLTQRRGKSTESVQVRHQNDGPPVPACLASSAEYLDEEMCTVTPFLELFAMSTIASTETDTEAEDEEEMHYRYIHSSFASQTALECWLNELEQCFEEGKLLASALGIDRIDDKQQYEDDEQYEDDKTQYEDDERQYVVDPPPTPENKAYQQQVLGRLWALMARNNCELDDSFDASNTSDSNTGIEDDEIQRKDSEHQCDDNEIHYEDNYNEDNYNEDNYNEATEYEEVSQAVADWKAHQKRASRTLSTIYEAQSYEEEYINQSIDRIGDEQQYVYNTLSIHQMKAYEEQKARRLLTLLQRMDDPPNEDCGIEHSFYFNNASTSKTGSESYEQYVDDEQRDKEPQAITDGNDDQRHVSHGLCTLLARNNGSPIGDCESEDSFRESNRSDDEQQYEEDPLPIEHSWYEDDPSTSLNLGSSEADMSTEQTRDSGSNLREPSEDSFFEYEPEASKSPVCDDAEMSIQQLKYPGGILSKFVQDIPETISIAEIDSDADEIDDKYELTKTGLAKCFVDYWIDKQEHYNIEAKALEKALSVEHVTDKDYETNYSPAPGRNKYGVAIHNWHGDVTHGLALDVGDCVEILEETTYWFRGTCPRKPRKVGLFPKSYIHLKDLSKVDPVVAECTLVLREWSEIWKRLFVEREEYKFTSLRKVMLALLESRRELLSSTLTQDQTYDLQMKVISKIDWGNRKLGLDLVPRSGTLAVDPQKIGIVSLHQVHVNSAENAKAASNRGTLRRKAGKKIHTHHLYFCMRDFGHRIGDDAEIYFYLYDGNTNRMRALSERFLVRIARDGFSTYVETSHNCTIFTDLGSSDLNQDLYLIANVMRVGKMLHSESVKKGDKLTTTTHAYRRPYGVGVLPLNEIAQFDYSVESEEKEFSFKIFQCEEKDYHQLHELIIKKASGKFQPINASTQSHYGLVVSMKLLHGEIGQAKLEQPILFQGTAITKKIGFPDVIMPGDVRNDLFLTLERGEFERVGISTAKNIEITALVLDENGRMVQECIAIASGSPLQAYYKSMVLYHNNSPAWNETIRMFVPIDKFSKAHVRFEFRSCSTRDKSDPKLFGFSFARLMEPGGATIADGAHELYVYKCEDALKVQPNVYLRLPCSAGDRQAQGDSPSPYHRSSKEAFYVRTILCSTKLTQNGDLLSLLQWRNRPEGIQDSLQRVLRLHNEELIKFLQDVLDALFALFSTDDGNSTPHSGLVFHVLVNIFSLMQSSKFQHFKPVMDAYIRNHFAAPLVYQGLLSSVQHLADWLTTTDNLEPIVQCFSSLEFIFKLIIQSRKLFAHASGGQYEDKFKNDLFSVFLSLNGMLAVPSTTQILATQEALLSNAGVVFEQLRTIITRPELETLVKSMLDAVPKDAQPPLIQAKLKSIKDMVSGQLFEDDELRSVILNIACKHLRIHLARRDELRLCSEILAEVLIKLYEAKAKSGEKPSNAIHHDLDTLFANIFPILLQTINVLSNGGNENLVCSLFAVKLGLLQLLDESHYQRMWDRQQTGISPTGGGSVVGGKELKDFIQQCLAIFKDILEQDWMIFSKDWLVMKMAANDVLRRTLEELAKPLVYRFLGPQSFDSQLWWSYFSVAVIFLTQPSLQIEQYHETKRRKLLSTHGDMRVMMGFQILSMWAQLGEHKLHFIPSMVGPFLEVTLVPEPALRKATFTVFYDMMQCEQVSRGSFRLVESELIDKLDLLISENKGDDEYRELFSTILLERVQTENPSWRESGIAFISSVTRLLERLLDYRSVMQGDENRDKRMTCTVNLLNFYNDEINRKEMYVRYIYKLLDLHLGAENYVEAGLTLKLYADMLSWDSENISDESNGPREWEQKEKIYKNIISYFDKGKCWEKGIPLCKELAIFYERKRFDYNRLSDALVQEAKFFQNILTQLRPEPEYFRVGYYGTGFPSFVRNKQFIYRGLEYERIGAFIQRLQTEFPTAFILDKKQYPPDSSILNSPEQRFHVVNVRPIADPYHLKSAKVTVPEKISKYYEVNDVTRFQYDRPVHKGTVDKDNEFKSLWIVRTIYETAQPLPGILRWFEVSKTSEHELTPVEFACETIANVNKELSDLIVQYRLDPKRNLNPFTMRLQGSVDANVNGGFSKYQDAFFSERFAKSAEGRDQSVHVQRLKRLIFEQMQILRQALELHRSLAPEQVLPLHNRLSEAFLELEKSTSEWKTNINIPTKPLPPLPIGQQQQPHGGGGTDLYGGGTGANGGKMGLSNGGAQELAYFPEDYDGTYMSVNKKTLSLSGIVPMTALTSSPAPHIPPRDSTGAVMLPAVCSPTAPPLPPRGHTPDKRSSNPMPFTEYVEQQQQQLQQHSSLPGKNRQKKYSLYEISLNDSGNYGSPRNLAEFRQGFYRDSGISTSTQELNNLNAASSSGATGGGPLPQGGEGCAQTPPHQHYHQPMTITSAATTSHDDYNIIANGNTLPVMSQHPVRGHQKTNSNPEAYQSIPMVAGTTAPSTGGTSVQPPPPPIPPKSASLHHQHSLPVGSLGGGGLANNNINNNNNNHSNNNSTLSFHSQGAHAQHLPPPSHYHHQRNQSLNLSTNSSSDGEQLSLNDISPAPPPMFNDNFSDSFSDECDNPAPSCGSVPISQHAKMTPSPGRSVGGGGSGAAGAGVVVTPGGYNSSTLNGSASSGEALELSSITTTTTTTTIISLRRDDEDEIFY